MRTRMYGGVRGRKTKIGGKPTFVFLLLDSLYPTVTETLDAGSAITITIVMNPYQCGRFSLFSFPWSQEKYPDC